jgi:hypothetical protein
VIVRKLLWTGIHSGLGAAATIAARKSAEAIWRAARGEAPPAKQ